MLAPGMRRTAQRTQVYNAIVSLGGHCTAEEIAAEIHKNKPGFPRSTVYRALVALTATGSVYAAHLG
ncbi:MAG: transcriptional repressor, partial [Candidatus Dormibacteraeota bacterium]|nr:transcriptional repressor [Candidatus Dormibacteraeota bacterium]